MRRTHVVFAVLAALGVIGAGCAKAAPGDTNESITVDGVHRTYVLHVPDGITGSVPLILSFHGHGGDGAMQSRLTGFDALSDRYRFIVAYPDGIDRAWNDGRPVNEKGPDDLGFAAALVEDLEHRYSIDPARVYATGFSNGATFSNFLACNQSNRFAAIAPVSGPLPVVDAPNCHPQRALSFLEINGTADPIVPFTGGQVVIAGVRRGAVLSFAQNGAFWAKNASCARHPTSTPLPAIAPPDGTSVTRTSFTGCRAGTDVVEYSVTGGGHTWPGGPQYLPKPLVGTASRQLDASETIVQFFLAHPMK